MAGWKRQPQERPGDNFFSGRGLITAGVNHALAPVEVAWIAATLRRAVLENNGLDYLQVFKCGDGRTVFLLLPQCPTKYVRKPSMNGTVIWWKSSFDRPVDRRV